MTSKHLNNPSKYDIHQPSLKQTKRSQRGERDACAYACGLREETNERSLYLIFIV